MPLKRIASAALRAAAMAALPLSGAKAQYPYPPCNPFPLSWPFCVVGAAAAIVSAPFRAAAGYPYYYSYPYYRYPYYGYYPPSTVYPAGTNGSPYAYYGPPR